MGEGPRPVVLVPHPHVRVDEGVAGGSPYVAGSRVLVRRIYGFYIGGTSAERLFRRYPQLGPAKIFDALSFALDNHEIIQWDIDRESAILSRMQRKGPP